MSILTIRYGMVCFEQDLKFVINVFVIIEEFYSVRPIILHVFLRSYGFLLYLLLTSFLFCFEASIVIPESVVVAESFLRFT